MKCLVVIAHPLEDSLCRALARHAVDTLAAAGHEVTVEDLYANGFEPAMTVTERRGYGAAKADTSMVAGEVARLEAAEALVLVFPTWWFGMPAILKGWFDRAWLPGVAFDHATATTPMKPRLTRLRKALAITSLGSPWWVDLFVMRRPVRRVLKGGTLRGCAPQCDFRMLSLHGAETVTGKQVAAFKTKIEGALSGWTG